MRFLTLLILLACMFGCANRHISASDSESKIVVGFACSFSGTETETVARVRSYIEAQNYNHIAGLLNSPLPGERYLAVATLQRLDSLGKYTLNDSQKARMANIRESSDEVLFCISCTYQQNVPMKMLFTTADIYGHGWWLDRVLKK